MGPADQLGYFGFYFKVYKGVNAISTPITLSDGVGYGIPDGNSTPRGVAQSNRWEEIRLSVDLPLATLNTLSCGIILLGRWDPDTDATELKPLDAWYVYFINDCNNLILLADAHGYPGYPQAAQDRLEPDRAQPDIPLR